MKKFSSFCLVLVATATVAVPRASVHAFRGGRPQAPHSGPRLSVWVTDFDNKLVAAPTPSSGAASTTAFPTSIGGDTSTSSSSTTTAVDSSPVILIAGSGSCLTPPDVPGGLAEMAITEMINGQTFDVVERAALQNIVEEQTRPGVAESSSKAQANKLKGAQLILKGVLTSFSYSGSATTGSIPLGFSVGEGSYTAKVELDLRIVDATTGEIYAAAHGTGGAKSSSSSFTFSKKDYNFSSTKFKDSPLAQACRNAIKNAISLLSKQTQRLPAWQAKIAAVTSAGEIYISAGKGAGLQIGDVFLVTHPGVAIPDPDNPGQFLGNSKGETVGKIKIVEVLGDRLAKAKAVDGSGYAVQDIVGVVLAGQ